MSKERDAKKNTRTPKRKAVTTSEEEESSVSDPIIRMPSSDSSTNISLQHCEDTLLRATAREEVSEIAVSGAATASPPSKQSTESESCRRLSPRRNVDVSQSPRKSSFSGALSGIKGYLSGSTIVKGAKEAYADTVTMLKSGIRSVSSSPEKTSLMRRESESESQHVKREDEDLKYLGFIDPDVVEKEDPETECMTDSTSMATLDDALEIDRSPEKSSPKESMDS